MLHRRAGLTAILAFLAGLAGCGQVATTHGDDTTSVVAPSITTQPSSQVVKSGEPATFSVVATGSDPLIYQWNRNGAAIAGATKPTYVTSPSSADDGAKFSVVVSNSAGAVESAAALLTVKITEEAPTITSQPADQTITTGQDAHFSVVATGSDPLSYQWNRDGAPIAGATSGTYTTTPQGSADTGTVYSVTVTNAQGTVTSRSATLTVNAPAGGASAPTITTQPADQAARNGQSATFTVAAAGTAPLSFQWAKNGAPIAGATGTSYTTPPATSTDNEAGFSVTVSNSTGNVTSRTARLTVSATAPTITSQPPDQTVKSGQSAMFAIVATGTAPLSYQWTKNGAAIAGATGATYTTPATASADNGAGFSVTVSNSAGSVTSRSARLTVSATAPSITSQPPDQTARGGQTATFTVTAAGTGPLSYQWQKNGAAITGAVFATYTTPAVSSADNGAGFAVTVKNSVGSITSRTAKLTVSATAPAITKQPQDQAVAAGQSATFSVVADGSAPLSYQWQKNGAAIAGATGASYTTPAVRSTDNGTGFTVTVSNSAGSITSRSARVTVSATAPTITTQPADQSVKSGGTATFTVAAAGTAPLTYQWQKNGAAIAGATGATYTTPAVSGTDSGARFTVTVSNSAGSITSRTARLSVSATAPTITTQPADQSVNSGQSATFTVTAAGTQTLTYQWQRSGAPIAGATSATYTIAATTQADNGATFAAVVTNSAGSITSRSARLTVTVVAAPTITNQPGDQSVAAGQAASFSVTAAGTGPLAYQWRRNGTAIAGATGTSFTTAATSASDSGTSYSVVVSNSTGGVTSRSALLTVTAAITQGSDVVTYKNDAGRTGQNLTETKLTLANVNSTSFGKLRFLSTDGKVDAQPLYLSALNINGTKHNVVFVATENDSVYAFDADSGAQLWTVSLVPAGETVNDEPPSSCDQVTPTIGITSTPVIEPLGRRDLPGGDDQVRPPLQPGTIACTP